MALIFLVSLQFLTSQPHSSAGVHWPLSCRSLSFCPFLSKSWPLPLDVGPSCSGLGGPLTLPRVCSDSLRVCSDSRQCASDSMCAASQRTALEMHCSLGHLGGPTAATNLAFALNSLPRPALSHLLSLHRRPALSHLIERHRRPCDCPHWRPGRYPGLRPLLTFMFTPRTFPEHPLGSGSVVGSGHSRE